MYQHFVREERKVATEGRDGRSQRKVALLMAGLPEHVSRLLNDESVSFLRRASSRYLGRIFDVEISDAFDCTVEAGGRTIEADARMACAKAADGFPYMMQLVGFDAAGGFSRVGSKSPAGCHHVGGRSAGDRSRQREMERSVLGST